MSIESTSEATNGMFENRGLGALFDSLEFRSLRRIVGIWGVAFVICCLLQQRRSYNFNVETAQIVVCCLGLVMASIWTVFYGELGWRRLLMYLSLVLLTVCAGVFLTGEYGDYLEMTLVTMLAAVSALAPFYMAKKFLGWRIVHPTTLRSSDGYGSQFSIAQIMSWTTFFAVLVVICNLVASKLFQRDISQFIFFALVAIALPTVIALLYLMMIGRLSTRSLLIATPVFALGVSIAICLIFVISNEGPGDVMRWIFWPNWIWFSIVGWVITAAVWLLQSRGFVFVFGGAIPQTRPESDLSFQTRSLEGRIASTTRWRGRVQVLSGWFVHRLDERKKRLEADLQSLRDRD